MVVVVAEVGVAEAGVFVVVFGLEEGAALVSIFDVGTVFVVEAAADVHTQLTVALVGGVDAFSF